MNIEQKIDQALANDTVIIASQKAIMTAIANGPTASPPDFGPELAAIQALSDKIDAEVGADSTVTGTPTPAATVAAANADASSAPANANTTSEAGAGQAS